MGKVVGMAEFKAHCTRLLREVEQGGGPITVTVRGKPVATVSSVEPGDAKTTSLVSAFGMLKNKHYHFDLDPEESACDPDWEAQWEAKWTERGYPASAEKPSCSIRTF